MLFDFSGHHSKNKIRKALRAAEVVSVVQRDGCTDFVQYYIKVGMYKVWLWLPVQANGKLKDFGEIMYSINDGSAVVATCADGRFRGQYWAKLDYVNINNLVDIIKHCQRLNDLIAFL